MSDYPLKDSATFSEWGGGVIPEQIVKCGLLIHCPNCGVLGATLFKNPIPDDDLALVERFQKAFAGTPMWDRTGDSLETISLTPSVMMREHFHSWVRNGTLCVDSSFLCAGRPPQ